MNLSILFFSVFIASSFFLPALSGKCHKNDRIALLSIKSGMGNPGGIITWGAPDEISDCCRWNGIQCDNGGRVTELNISDDSVSGQISSSIGDLRRLTSLALNYLTNLTGTIPDTIAKLTSLTSLRLDHNDLSGPVPGFLSQLTKLGYLDLSFNHFSGSIPSSLGELPLTYLALDNNGLTGLIPESIAGIPNIGGLYLSDNNLSGTIPEAFANTTKLSVIFLSNNSLGGDASVFFGENKPLTALDLSMNMFEFDLSNVKLPKNIVVLDLNHNKIYGGIPSHFTELSWQYFNVSFNRLCGPIPTGGGFDGFAESTFTNNMCLCGAPLPDPCKSTLFTDN